MALSTALPSWRSTASPSTKAARCGVATSPRRDRVPGHPVSAVTRPIIPRADVLAEVLRSATQSPGDRTDSVQVALILCSVRDEAGSHRLRPHLLHYSTYLGGPGDDFGRAIAVDALPNPNAYVAGTAGSNFPTTPAAFQPAFGGGSSDAFVAQITEAVLPPGPFSARVTGGGTIDVDAMGGIGSFHFIIQRQADGTLSGRLQYFNHVSGARVQSVMYTSLMIVGNTATV